jgi:hypothetical protein
MSWVGDGFIGNGIRLTYVDGVPKQHAEKEDGEGLTACNKSRLKPYFPDVDFDKVRVHFGFPKKARFTGTVFDYVGVETLRDARAIVIGNDIYFRSKDFYNPDSISGIAEIGHEVTHVAQKLSPTQYIGGYLKLRQEGLNDHDAYRFNPPESEAFKKQELIERDLTNLRNQLGEDVFWSPCPPLR